MSKTYHIEWAITGTLCVTAATPEEAIAIFDRTSQCALAETGLRERHSEALTAEQKAVEDQAFSHWLKSVFTKDQEQEHSRCLAESST